jgi:co-chaperonin GroES (HSP10)
MDRVLVERIAPATKSVGGVLLPESMTGKTVRRRRGRRLAKDGRRRRAHGCMNE